MTTLHEGLAIESARGTVGTAGCLALALHERRLVFLTSHHVLRAGGGAEHEAVRVIDGDRRARVGTVRWGRRGTVRHDGVDVHVDCAVVELDGGDGVPPGWRLAEEDASCAIAAAAPGMRVTKSGAATGVTHGTIDDASYDEPATIDGVRRRAPRQILVRSTERGRPFAARGDSGAMLRDERGALVGLLWGATAAGDGVACPIAPALWVLHARPVRLVADGRAAERES